MSDFPGERNGSKHEKWSPRRSRYSPGDRHPYRALFIGINYENDEQLRLRGCQQDVAKAQKALAKMGFVPGESRFMIDSSTGKDYPTRENIIDALCWLVDGAQRGDVLFLHFSGHGESVRDGSGDEEDGKDEAIVPIDARKAGLIADDVINSIICENLPRGANFYGVFDCCHSGTIMDLQYVYDESSNRMLKVNGSGSEGNVVMIAGCLSTQKGADLPPKVMLTGVRKSIGALTNALYKRMTKGYSWQSLITETRSHIHFSKLTQIPQLESSGQIDPNARAFDALFPRDTRGAQGKQTKTPRATTADALPIGVLQAYRNAGKRIAGWRAYAASGQLKTNVLGLFKGGKRGSSSAGSSSSSSSSSSASDEYYYSDEDYDYDDDYYYD